MNYEKLHKDTITRLQEMVNSGKITVKIARGICADFIPENEDERIRKIQLEYWSAFGGKDWYGVPVQKVISWLQKQGEHANFINKIQIGDKVTRNEDGVLVNLSQLNRVAKKQGEQKPYGQRQECVDCQFNYAGECKGSCAMKRGEQNPAWSEEDNKNLERTIWYVEKGGELIFAKADELVSWLKSLKDRVQPQPKQEWSEEDETRLTNIIIMLKEGASLHFNKKDITKAVDWLKSLKHRYTWKPSDKHMKALYHIIEDNGLTKCKSENEIAIEDLVGQLEKLRK